MNDDIPEARVPARLVLASLIALWACYFLVATLRGIFLGFEFDWPIISRRLTICIVSMLVMAALWPLLQLLDRRSFGTRVAVVMLGALPVSLALGAINEAVFSDIDGEMPAEQQGEGGNVRISRDDAGNILVDLPPAPPKPPAPPVAPVPAPGAPDSARAPQVPAVPPTAAPAGKPPQAGTGSKITLQAPTDERATKRWAVIADTAFGRYFLVLAWAALYFALVKAEEARAAERREGEYRRAAAAAELRSLRYQVNPHFLFNTLNSLSALVMTGRQDDAEQMIQTLSTFYRHTLSGDPTNDLPLADEIELQQLYLAIEGVRFPSRLLTQIDVDADVADAMVPGMILQPLVENSVKYAVASTREPVTITIAARREDGFLCLSVSDNGPGARQGETHGCGIGLGNVRDRLRARFGDAASLAFGKRADGGFSTVIRIPLELARA
ncbi:sensor histidine kinase [Novosphingobium album (ex Liu et al. 2023)]|uniref:Histidine kinase n=1 Tax=Novosphingobium album (ex Liu et al. 2023) TaxID=3031130 RepID=A0ABT5WNZ9_9SPHN|nr:histidine kinase [Novosphingobium album (ex Liu et al. 2023)]MDE8651751.1 histidine kinase [Novosphingobium album (ex Liu et al. 2023)]